MDAEEQGLERARASSRAIVAIATVLVVGLLFWVLGAVFDVVALLFAGVLLAVFLCGIAGWLSRRTRLRRGWALGATVVALAAVVAVSVWLIAPSLAAQVDELAQRLPQAARRITEHVERYAWGRKLVARLAEVQGLPHAREALLGATRLLSTTLGAVTGALIVLFVGLFLAAEPAAYRKGLLRLTPVARRARAAAVLDDLGHILRRWLLGRLLSMAVVGVMTWIGLALLGIRLALSLAVLAATLAFVPYIGPVLALLPAALLGLLQGPAMAGYVVALYLGVQLVESYLITPLIQRSTVALPPGLILATQVLMGALTGGLGVVLATPMLAALVVLTKRVYVEGVLGDTSARQGEDAPLPGIPERPSKGAMNEGRSAS
ncbi:AI-2E family transporter [Sorangium sp. So ce1036]|uniref:AI-2E family transporter n=1 Tax=Sorangium sp. So ce1036 TaxID=3133328 RepID=UPI003F029227